MDNREDDFIEANAKDLHRPRKRKLDEDGFVCPTTPDIPKSSQQYVEVINHGNIKGMDCASTFGGNFSLTGAESVSVYFAPVSGGDNSGCAEKGRDHLIHEKGESSEQFTLGTNSKFFNNAGDNQSFQSETTYPVNPNKVDSLSRGLGVGNLPGNTSLQARETLGQHGEDVGQSVRYDGTDNLPNGEGAATQEGSESLLQYLFRGFEQDSSSMFENWSKIFRQCGEYETMCQQRLDDLSYGARSIEDSLNSKKEVLCNRLKGIGQTLET